MSVGRKNGRYILCASESKNLDRERRNEAGRKLDEMDFPRRLHSFDRAEIAKYHYQDEVCWKETSDRVGMSQSLMNGGIRTAGKESDIACMSKAV